MFAALWRWLSSWYAALPAWQEHDWGQVNVAPDDTPELVARKVQRLLPTADSSSPVGQGRPVVFPPGMVLAPPMLLSTMQTLKGTKGSSHVGLDPTGLTAGEYGLLTLAHDSRSKHGIRGNGVIRDLDFDGRRQVWAPNMPGVTVHGYFAPDRPSGEKCISHRMDNSAFHNMTGHGVYIGAGNDQLVANRLRAESNLGFAAVIKSSDVKGHDWGLQSKRGALLILGAAPELDTVDLFIPDDAECEGTLHIHRSHGAQVKGGTVSGRTIIRGRNAQGPDVRFENADILLDALAFKHDKMLHKTRYYNGGDPIKYHYDSYVLAEDIDGVKLRAPRFVFDVATALDELPLYLIRIATTTDDPGRMGKLFLSDAIGLVHVIGRFEGEIVQRMGCRSHWCDHPELTVFDWGLPGRPEPVPLWAVNHPDPTLVTHVAMDGVFRRKDLMPFGYLAATIDPVRGHGTLDDDALGWTPEAMPYISSNTCWGQRVVP